MGSTEDDMCHSSGMNTNLLFEKVAEMGMSSNGANPFFNSCWDPLSQTQFANPACPILLENQAISSFSHPVHYQSDSGLCKMVPKLPCFGSGGLSEMVSSFGPSEFGCPPNYPQNKEGTSEEEEDSYSGKKKGRDSYSNSPFNPIKNAEGEKEKEPSEDSSGFQKEQQDKKKRRIEQNIGKQAKGNSDSREAPKENYIHMRAKRGQATNNHSLAERVRREKISERMKILQELVPGCNKITGKAVMLDEIINYVQSLQQQVEFLSMKLATVNPKLATVNPELKTDIEQILSKDILHLRGSNAAILGFGPGLSSSNPYTQGITQGSLSGIPSTTPPFYHLPQTLWDNELQSLFQMGFDSNPTNNNSVPNGSSKLEL